MMRDEAVIPLDEAKRRRTVDDAEDRIVGPAIEPSGHEPYRILGHDRGTFYFLPDGAKQVVGLPNGALTKNGLLMLAPLNYWQREFPSRGGADWLAATNTLMQAAFRAGIFDVGKVRGRGAWWDAGRVVLHLGDYLLVDGERTEIGVFETRYIYEAAASFGIQPRESLSNKEAHAFLELCQMLRFERPYMATLLAGWCVVAPVCGALGWRPHIWIVGPSGSGKTWVMDNILKAAVSGIALFVQSKTTEAGVRQALGSDARPVVFDEAEGESLRDRDRLQQVLDLARQASSEGGPGIIKGHMSGVAREFHVRSSFACSSINDLLKQQADQTRFSVLSLLGDSDGGDDAKRQRQEHFDAIRAAAAALLGNDFPARLLARSAAMLPVIRKNAETYARAAAEILQSRRLGDQIGAMLAGAAALHHRREVTLEEARTFMQREGWVSEAASIASEEPDHDKLLAFLCQQTTVVRQGNGSMHERTFGDLIAIAGRHEQDDHVFREAAETHLRRHGIRVDIGRAEAGQPPPEPMVWIATSHSAIERLLRDTPWAAKWSGALTRVAGAVKSKNGMKFGHGALSRAVGIPTWKIVGGTWA